ncbi:MaoC family dehydratase N-terminal domain-containing protein [Comamonadaceae bacterium G21597-S1]|nr:MaoC family dehydratase N-terminal domain-containing protein [Comamonadaceae bacterium G21597-S1]
MTPSNAPVDPKNLEQLQGWVGRTESRNDEIRAAPMRALAATLDRDDAQTGDGSVLHPLWHWLFFLPIDAHSKIGPDGHPRRGDFLPPIPLPRRMWAGSRITWENGNPLRVGNTIRRDSRILSVDHKSGRAGDLVFVAVQHDIHNATGLALSETQNIVYRDAARSGDPVSTPMAAGIDAPWQREMTPDEVLLFRYSALTFNSHRIHFDRPYATDVEGYPGLVVHGPLLATLLLDLVYRNNPAAPIQTLDIRAVRPSFAGQPIRMNGRPATDEHAASLWAQDHQDNLTMRAEVQFA